MPYSKKFLTWPASPAFKIQRKIGMLDVAFDSDDEKNLMKKTYGSWIILPDHP